jgi:CheY-like chemotaxis protein
MLERLGFAVVTAGDGQEAVSVYRARADEIACVVLDLTMPRMDGEEAFRELRQVRPDVRVILSSGYNEQEVTQRFAGKGLAGFLEKPYRLETLRAQLRRVLDQGAQPGG